MSTSVRLPHLCQECHDYCVITVDDDDGGWGQGEGGNSFMLGFWLETGGGYNFFSIFCSVFVLLLIILS